MKYFVSLLFILLSGTIAHTQKLTAFVDSYTGDSTFSTGFDTLSNLKPADKNGVPDRVVGVRSVHKGESKYWLFFYFSTSDITSKAVKISNRNFAYFVLTNNEYIRLPYTGKTGNYAANDNAGFFIDITGYIDRLQSARVKIIRFETSTLYHEILLPEKSMSKIAGIVNKLLE